jgi:hypothetical protein
MWQPDYGYDWVMLLAVMMVEILIFLAKVVSFPCTVWITGVWNVILHWKSNTRLQNVWDVIKL